MGLDYHSIDTFTFLIEACKDFKVHPSMPIAAEDYFIQLLNNYEGEMSDESIMKWLRQEISHRFVSFAPNEKRPEWIQGDEWLFSDGEPMFFMGQIEIIKSQNPHLKGYFHDDTSIYVFMDKEGNISTVIQEY
jgi:hypothetical protein